MEENKAFESLIGSVKSPLIVLPLNPYFDQVAAGLSLYLGLLEKSGASIVCPSPMIVEFNRLVGVNKVASEVGNKNLVIRFRDYPSSDIERVSYDIENQQFRLTVIPKDGFEPPKEGQVDLSYSGVSTDGVILVGGKRVDHFPILGSKDLKTDMVLHIGINELEGIQGGKVASFAEGLSSVSELVVSLMDKSQIEITEDIASNLLMGIEEGTDGFSGQNVTADTFLWVSKLMNKGGRRVPKEKKERGSDSQKPAVQATSEPNTPKSWLKPKVYKGTSIK